MHAIEKYLAKAANKERVSTGEIVTAKVDLVEVNDLYLQVIKSFKEMGGDKVWNPDKVSFVFDHYSPTPTIKAADNHKKMREFCREQDIDHLFDINAGVCHQVLPEAGLVHPGMILVATDSHTTTHGAFGAFGTGVGATDLATILLSGELWFKVPEIIKIKIDGELKPNVMAKDVILHILGELKQDAAVYKAIEFTGSVVEEMSVAERMVLCNMSVEMGAKTTYIKPDQKTLDYLEPRVNREFEIVETDEDFEYVEVHHFDVSDLDPSVAKPHSIDNVDKVSNVVGEKVDQVFIGTCTGGRVNDIRVAAEILEGKKIADDIRLVVIPASDEVYKTAMEKGYIQTLVDSGATISAPGCGPCLGAHQGVLADGETCVATSSRNFPGRMGSTGAKVYSASPATAALTALKGSLADPGELKGRGE
ncbi:3-isopropylmalate dehydratase large subunit [Selenihalanaerobacter shriftii]|uniref:3-isopropylmalate dehydratase large subunit n=1 Tax=Selenihalanaerobacter shriftii TaxID=142842 RepID=A0A1T4K1B9_9FIRM|nr:3-isopropylmalate dehydratase large subunit [Selenihalanaerobacter shriftii]SJZ36276.1 3-isopropylmalate/(R)-2-methylmalate dehydratase large subunit [Selenihalanaerobacter shriftii]